MSENLENLSPKGYPLKEYYLQLPERTAPKSDFLEKIVSGCAVTMTTARNWVLYGIRPNNPEHIRFISELTGISEEDLWKD